MFLVPATLNIIIIQVGNQYCCSFPFDKAIDPYGDVILAYEMNGKPIPRSHGFPVRAIVPGHAGARFCKFLEKVSITDIACKVRNCSVCLLPMILSRTTLTGSSTLFTPLMCRYRR